MSKEDVRFPLSWELSDQEALIRERRMKKWKCDWKIQLVESMDPSWMDLSMNWNLDYNNY